MHDPTYAKKYGKVIRWQGFFMAAQMSTYGLLIASSLVLPLFIYGYISVLFEQTNDEAVGMMSALLNPVGQQIGIQNLASLVNWFGQPRNLLFFAASGAAVGLASASFRYFRLRYNAELLMAVSQIATEGPGVAKTKSKEPSSLASLLPICSVAIVWVLIFCYLLWPVAAPKIVAVYSADPNGEVLIVKFEKPLTTYSEFYVQNMLVDGEQVETEIHNPFGGYYANDLETGVELWREQTQTRCLFNSTILSLAPIPQAERSSAKISVEVKFSRPGSGRTQVINLPIPATSNELIDLVKRLEEEAIATVSENELEGGVTPPSDGAQQVVDATELPLVIEPKVVELTPLDVNVDPIEDNVIRSHFRDELGICLPIDF